VFLMKKSRGNGNSAREWLLTNLQSVLIL